MTEQELDYWHDQGKVPDWWYYQKSSKPIWMKWQEQTDNFKAEIEEREKLKRQEQDLQAEVEQEVGKQLEQAVNKALEDLFKDFL